MLDPFAGTGTTLCVAYQLHRNSIGIEIDPQNCALIENRLENIREADLIQKYYTDYRCTEDISKIWGKDINAPIKNKPLQSFSILQKR